MWLTGTNFKLFLFCRVDHLSQFYPNSPYLYGVSQVSYIYIKALGLLLMPLPKVRKDESVFYFQRSSSKQHQRKHYVSKELASFAKFFVSTWKQRELELARKCVFSQSVDVCSQLVPYYKICRQDSLKVTRVMDL